jgi:hypothetical protein
MLSALLLLAASSIPIEVGKFDATKFPDAKKVERRMPQADLVRRVDTILGEKACALPGQSKDKYDIVVPYAVLIQPSGAPSKIVVKDIGCAPIETLVGQIASELAKAGDFRPGHSDTERWYVSEADFAHGGETLASSMADENRVVCESPRPRTGSRLAMTKVCRTAAEWRVYETDRAQMQRDLAQRGMVAESK